MEVDTGASASPISMATYESLWSISEPPPLKQIDFKRRTYTVKMAGMVTVDVTHYGQTKQLPLLVVEGKGPSLLGRDWLEKFTLDWWQIHQFNMTGTLSLNDVLLAHPDVFKDKLGEVRGVEAVDPTVAPRFYRLRPVAYALRSKVEHELSQLKIISPVKFSAPIVLNVKTIHVLWRLQVYCQPSRQGRQIPTFGIGTSLAYFMLINEFAWKKSNNSY